jgi:glycosyltransferase involved in cell wall biosynthesis
VNPTLGVVAISYNEERDLPGFIENLQSWVDEITIVDDGSTDKTEHLVKAAGTKVNFITSPRKNDEYFSDQRNKGIAAAKSNWLLHMDIDERVTPELASEILESIKCADFDAYRFRRLNFFLHRPMKGGGWQDWNLVHLAKREKLRFEGMFHEKCVVRVSPERIGQLKGLMWHLNDESYVERMNKSNLYCQEQASRLKEKEIHIQWWHFLIIPSWEFLGKYLKRRGYRDGVLGLIFALHAAAAMFRACAMVWDEQNRIPRSNLEEQLQSSNRAENGAD